MRVQERFLVVRQAPFRHDGAAARDDARQALGRHRHIAQQHTGVDGEVIDTLLGLLDEGVAEDFPRQIFGLAIDLFQRLVDGHGADGHGAVAHDPFARFVDMFTRRQVHHIIAAPADGPGHLFHFLADGRGDGGIADVRVDFHQEIAADNHRFHFRVVDVGGNDGAAAGDFLAHEFGRDFGRDAGAE